MVSSRKQLEIKRQIAFQLRKLRQGFEFGELNENLRKNADETDFVFNSNNAKTFHFIGDKKVKYSCIVSGWQSGTETVRLADGRREKICRTIVSFKN